MDDEFLMECIENETENSFFDFKKDIYDFSILQNKEDFLTDIISFANGHSKGNKYIITGVKLHEDGSRSLEGITEGKQKDGADYQSLINDNVEPNIIIDFKLLEYNDKKYGIFRINSENEDRPYLLSKQFGKLSKGFIKIRRGQKNEYATRRDFDLFYKEKNSNEISNIYLKGIANSKTSDKFIINKFEIEIDVEKVHEIISQLFLEVKQTKLIKNNNQFKFGSELFVNERDIESINYYAKENKIDLPDDFYDIGNMTYFSMMGSGTKFYGNESERKKYDLICDLGNKIAVYKGYKDFYDETNNIFYIELVISNLGKKYDEDIEVTLKIEKDKFLPFNEFPIPSEAIIEDVLDNAILEKYLKIEKTNDINTYTAKYPSILPPYPLPTSYPLYGSSNPSYESLKEYYNELILGYADYEIIEDDKYFYIRFEQKEIKPNDNISIPSKLLFKTPPDYIEYEIKTKHNPNIQKGKIHREKD